MAAARNIYLGSFRSDT